MLEQYQKTGSYHPHGDAWSLIVVFAIQLTMQTQPQCRFVPEQQTRLLRHRDEEDNVRNTVTKVGCL